jgi:hypothetical protein
MRHQQGCNTSSKGNNQHDWFDGKDGREESEDRKKLNPSGCSSRIYYRAVNLFVVVH